MKAGKRRSCAWCAWKRLAECAGTGIRRAALLKLALLRRAVKEDVAQGTVEYALTVLALLGIVLVLGLLWRAGERGSLAELANKAASHGLDGLGALDISLF